MTKHHMNAMREYHTGPRGPKNNDVWMVRSRSLGNNGMRYCNLHFDSGDLQLWVRTTSCTDVGRSKLCKSLGVMRTLSNRN